VGFSFCEFCRLIFNGRVINGRVVHENAFGRANNSGQAQSGDPLISKLPGLRRTVVRGRARGRETLPRAFSSKKTTNHADLAREKNAREDGAHVGPLQGGPRVKAKLLPAKSQCAGRGWDWEGIRV